MCGRYYMDPDDVREYAADANFDEAAKRRGTDIAPGMDAPAIVDADSEPRARIMRWGFERESGGLVINARVETMGERGMFKGLARRQRCALPASKYYEWRRGDRQKFDISLPGRFFIAGLWRIGGDGPEFVVLTQPPVPAIEPVHNRMPLLLPTVDAMRRWLAGETPLYSDSAALRVHADGPEQMAMRF